MLQFKKINKVNKNMKNNIVKSNDSNISKIAYYIGGFIIVLGIIAFIVEQWNNWGELF